MKIEVKRGYVKWTDENGIRHKVLEEEYEAVKEINEPEIDDQEATGLSESD